MSTPDAVARSERAKPVMLLIIWLSSPGPGAGRCCKLRGSLADGQQLLTAGGDACSWSSATSA